MRVKTVPRGAFNAIRKMFCDDWSYDRFKRSFHQKLNEKLERIHVELLLEFLF